MKASKHPWIFWAPRLLALLFAVFISLFALDVFEEHRGIGETLLALLLHLIPTAVLLVLLGIAWRWEWIGALAFPCLGLLYIALAWGRLSPVSCAVIAGPLFLIGGLFLAGWQKRLHQERPGGVGGTDG